MAQYRTYFERFNSRYSPPLRQFSDVVFELTDDMLRDDDATPISDAMWKAMWEQNPHWKDCRGGWSSVLGGHICELVVLGTDD